MQCASPPAVRAALRPPPPQLRRQPAPRLQAAPRAAPPRHAGVTRAAKPADGSNGSRASRPPLDRTRAMTLEAAPAVATAAAPPAEATVLVSCPDQMGVVAALSQLLFGYGVNIISSDQFSDLSAQHYFQRLHIDYSRIIVGPENVNVLESALATTAKRFDMTWSIHYHNQPKRMAVMVSKLDHCLYDLLYRHQSNELPCSIPIIISNHPDLEFVAKQFNIPFKHLPMVGDDKVVAKAAQEAQIEALLDELNIDLIVMARYMQVLSTGFCERNATRTINIHHSFLPAFEGGRPYHRAHDRGVKIIGATAHYATAELDAGPIIEQDVTRITHRESVTNMVRKGKDLERMVLARAVRAHLESRVIVFGNRTVVFEENA